MNSHNLIGYCQLTSKFRNVRLLIVSLVVVKILDQCLANDNGPETSETPNFTTEVTSDATNDPILFYVLGVLVAILIVCVFLVCYFGIRLYQRYMRINQKNQNKQKDVELKSSKKGGGGGEVSGKGETQDSNTDENSKIPKHCRRKHRKPFKNGPSNRSPFAYFARFFQTVANRTKSTTNTATIDTGEKKAADNSSRLALSTATNINLDGLSSFVSSTSSSYKLSNQSGRNSITNKNNNNNKPNRSPFANFFSSAARLKASANGPVVNVIKESPRLANFSKNLSAYIVTSSESESQKPCKIIIDTDSWFEQSNKPKIKTAQLPATAAPPMTNSKKDNNKISKANVTKKTDNCKNKTTAGGAANQIGSSLSDYDNEGSCETTISNLMADQKSEAISKDKGRLNDREEDEDDGEDSSKVYQEYDDNSCSIKPNNHKSQRKPKEPTNKSETGQDDREVSDDEEVEENFAKKSKKSRRPTKTTVPRTSPRKKSNINKRKQPKKSPKTTKRSSATNQNNTNQGSSTKKKSIKRR